MKLVLLCFSSLIYIGKVFFAKLLATASKADNTIFELATLGDATRV
jgi:hypothetical protein